MLLDGTLPPIDRIAADCPFYSGKHKEHGMNVQVLADLSGRAAVGVAGSARSRPRCPGRP